VIILMGVAVALYGALYAVDRMLIGRSASDYFEFQSDRVTDAVGSLSGLFAAILGIIITVVSIIVQLTAERFTHVTQMFLRDRTNLAVLGFYVLACIWGVLNSFSLQAGWVPRITMTAVIGLGAACFAVMAPYFRYVFEFVQPENIIHRIRSEAEDATDQGARSLTEAQRATHQAIALSRMEELTDVAINSVSSKDKIIAVAAVDALKDFAVRYLTNKKHARKDWFIVSSGIRKNPDFVSMAAGVVDDMERRHTWVEWKVMRQYQGIYADALAHMKDVAYVIAIDTRYIGETAIAVADGEALGVVIKFFNSYLRATLNARDVRTAYNLLNQYRELIEALLRAGWDDKAAEVGKYIKYYSHISFRMGLPFVTETCAYDLCALCELAHDLKSPAESTLLKVFLEIDQPSMEGDTEETGLRGVRKAQIKLATYYIQVRAENLARLIHEDMIGERPERLRSIREELLSVTSEDFWEVIDRGRNFDYLTPERKEALAVFYSWFPRHTKEQILPKSMS
jgi:hypothetical protein